MKTRMGRVSLGIAAAALVLAPPALAGFAPVSGSPFAVGHGPDGIAFKPSGGVLFAVNRYDGDVVSFHVPASGQLTMSGSPVAVGSFPEDLALSPGGAALATANYGDRPATVSLFGVGSGGLLTPVAGSPFAFPLAPFNRPYSVAFNADGSLLATGNNASANLVSVFHVGSGGTLTPVAGSPFGTGDGSDIAFSPHAALLAVARGDINAVTMYQVSGTGQLTEVPGSPFPTGTGPVSLAFSPDGQLLAVSNFNDGTVSVFRVAAGGALTPVPGSPFHPAGAPGAIGLAFNGEGGLLAVANGTGGVAVFHVGADGRLTEAAGSPFPAGSDPYEVAFSPDGGLIAAANTWQDTLSVLRVGPPSATLTTPAAGATYAVGQIASASYGCADDAVGPGIASCTGTAPGGTSLDTSAAGTHSFSVTATSRDGQTATVTHTYTVARTATQLTAARLRGATVSATLTAGTSRTPLAGRSIRFVVGARTGCTATTNTAGVAACTLSAIDQLSAIVAGHYGATFAGDTAYEPTGATGLTR